MKRAEFYTTSGASFSTEMDAEDAEYLVTALKKMWNGESSVGTVVVTDRGRRADTYLNLSLITMVTVGDVPKV